MKVNKVFFFCSRGGGLNQGQQYSLNQNFEEENTFLNTLNTLASILICNTEEVCSECKIRIIAWRFFTRNQKLYEAKKKVTNIKLRRVSSTKKEQSTPTLVVIHCKAMRPHTCDNRRKKTT